jgi:MoaA/NifB/PqqE/SkfB family radical SAM enzyme
MASIVARALGKSFAEYATPRKACNLLASVAEFHLGRRQLSSWPSRLTIDITNRCMLKCPLCPSGQGKVVPKGTMTPDQLDRIMREVGPYLYHVDLFNWGEPLLHPDLFTMLRIVRDAGVASVLSSTLSFPPSDRIDRLALEGPDRLVVSLDGATQAVHEKYRVGGRLDWALENVRRIQALKARHGRQKPAMAITCHVTKFNEHQLPLLRELAQSLGIPIGLNPLCVNARNEAMFAKWLPSDPCYSCYDYDTRRHKSHTRGRCEWLWRTMVINWDGTVNPCCYWFDEPSSFGNVIDDGVRTVWNGEAYVAARTALSRGVVSEAASVCGRCQGVPPDTEELPPASGSALNEGAKTGG